VSARPTKANLVALLDRHIGRDRGVTAAAIAEQLRCAERLVRELVTELRLDGVAVCGRPETGYFIAATAEELQETCAFLRARAMHSLTLESRMRRVPLPDLLGQLRLKT
jgi:biotin operon repressor